LNLVHVLVYMQTSKRFEHHSLVDLQAVGFISEPERRSLQHHADPPGLATFWIGHFIVELHEAGVFDANLMTNLMRSVSDLRSATSSLVQEVQRKAPLSFAQLIQLSVDATCILTSPAILHKFLVGRSYPLDYVFVGGTSTMTSTTTTTSTTSTTQTGVAAMAMMFEHSRLSFYMMPMIGSAVVTMLYQSGLQVVKETEDPFSVGMDRMNPDIVLDRTEKRIASYLRKDSSIARTLQFPGLKPPKPKRRHHDDDDEDVDPGLFGLTGPDGQPTLPISTAKTVSASPLQLPLDEEDLDESPIGRQRLPTAVVLSGVTLDNLTDGAHQDARDLHRGVNDKLHKLEKDLLHVLEEDDPYLVALTQLLPKLHQDSLSNCELREQVVKAVAGIGKAGDERFENPTPSRLNRMQTRSTNAPLSNAPA